MRLLVAGYSSRALAQTALAGGYDVVAVDYFGDRDLAGMAPIRSIRHDLGGRYLPSGLVRLSRAFQADAVAYTGGLENHPGAVAALAKGRELWGNLPSVLAEVRDWRILASFFTARGIPFPETLFPGDEAQARQGARWLSKPERGAGGRGVRFWRGERLERGRVLQEFLPGEAGSATFLCDGKGACLIAVTEQLVGVRAFVKGPFTWCGNIFPSDLSRKAPEAGAFLRHLGGELTARFGLRGLNGIDFILTPRGGRLLPLPVEINPRPTASLEIIEAFFGESLFPFHVEACRGGLLRLLPSRGEGFRGNAVVYARRGLLLPETDDWYDKRRRDIPHRGEQIPAGAPVCTVLADGPDREGCLKALLAAAGEVRRETGDVESLQERGGSDGVEADAGDGPDSGPGRGHAQGQDDGTLRRGDASGRDQR